MDWFWAKSKENEEECDLNSSHYTEKLQKEIESFSMVNTDDIIQHKHPFADTYENELAPSIPSNDNITTNITVGDNGKKSSSKDSSVVTTVMIYDNENDVNNKSNTDDVPSVIDVDDVPSVIDVDDDDICNLDNGNGGNNKCTDTVGLNMNNDKYNNIQLPKHQYKYMPMRSMMRPFGLIPFYQTCLWTAQTKPFYKDCCDILNKLDEHAIKCKPNRDLANTILEKSPSCKMLMEDIINQLELYNIANIDIKSASAEDYVTIVRILYNMKYCTKTETVGDVIMVTIYPKPS